jgi:hypothetical protein
MSASPTCTETTGLLTVTCSWASPILTINVQTLITAAVTTTSFNASLFTNPSTALDNWPSIGGFSV